MTQLNQPVDQQAPPSRQIRIVSVLPGLGVCLAAASVSYFLASLVPGVSPLIVAIVFGVLAANTTSISPALAPGVDFSAKKLLRVGIVLLGLQLVLGDIAALGAPILAVVACIVVGGLVATVAMGRLLGIGKGLSLLIACGFSICGAAAVAGASGVIDPEDEAEEDTITAVALVVIFGTLMIALIPMASGALGMDERSSGLWAGGSIHEIAQVVAASGLIGTSALQVAVVVKLARVLLLAPIVAILSIRQRRLMRGDRAAGSSGPARTKTPPIVPIFVVGFIAAVMVRSFVPVGASVLKAGALVQTVLLAAAMFGLGLGVKFSTLARVGPRPFALAALSTAVVTLISWAGVVLASGS